MTTFLKRNHTPKVTSCNLIDIPNHNDLLQSLLATMNLPRLILVILLFSIQAIFIILFVSFVDYDTPIAPKFNHPPVVSSSRFDLPSKLHQPTSYASVQILVFIGLGYLHTTLRNYSLSSLVTTLIIGVISVQYGILCSGLFHHLNYGKIILNIKTLVYADYLTTAILIAISSSIGTVSFIQLILVTLVGGILFAVNEYVAHGVFQAVDIGGAMYIHVFGAFYGLAVSRCLCPSSKVHACYKTLRKRISRRTGLFSLLGTFVLFVYWPNFNAILSVTEYEQMRIIYNTLLALCGSVSCTFILSILLSAESKIALVHIQNATLAGGVAVSAVANLMIRPFGALIIGCVAGGLSTLTYTFVTPFLEEKLQIHDSCGVLALHGIPGIFGGIFSSIVAAASSEYDYGPRLYTTFPAMAPPKIKSKAFQQLLLLVPELLPGCGRSRFKQAGYQLAALSTSIGIGLVGGLLTGWTLKWSIFGKLSVEAFYVEYFLWEKEHFTTPSSELNKLIMDINSESGLVDSENQNDGIDMEIKEDTKKISFVDQIDVLLVPKS